MNKLSIIETIAIILLIISFAFLAFFYSAFQIGKKLVNHPSLPALCVEETIDFILFDSLIKENLIKSRYYLIKEHNPTYILNIGESLTIYPPTNQKEEAYDIKFISSNSLCVIEVAFKKQGVWIHGTNGDNIGFWEKRRIRKHLEETFEKALKEHQELHNKAKICQ